MYIFVNNDLKMTKGKIAAQVGHVVQLITEEIVRRGYERNPPPIYFTYMKWKSHSKKIILKASEEQLRVLIKENDARFIIDAGLTQIPAGSLTVVGFYPSASHAEKFKSFKLL